MSSARPLHALLAVFEKTACGELRTYLQAQGWTCDLAETARQVDVILLEQTPDLVLVELGATLADPLPLERLRQVAPGILVVAVAVPDAELYFQAARAGIEAVLPLPLDPQVYLPKLDAVCAQLRARIASGADNLPGKAPVGVGSLGHAPAGGVSAQLPLPSLFATSEDMAEVRELIEKVAPTSATVLLRGESGVGKELAARLIHSQSLRSGKAFVKVNCAAIPNDLLESELFGYEAGAFTGAIKGKPGKFEQADGGTLFLDEIAELHPILQAKLLHVLQDGEFARLGSKKDTSVDVRVICASNQPLDRLVANGQFREDLYYRINVVAVNLPPLRARRREIPVLVDFFLRRYASLYNKPLVPLRADAVQALTEYHWPGNVRELENLCKQYVIVGGIEQILRGLERREERRQPLMLEKSIGVPVPPLPNLPVTKKPTLLEIGRQAAWAAERVAIEDTLRETHWNRREAARRLGVSYKALLNKIGQLMLELKIR